MDKDTKEVEMLQPNGEELGLTGDLCSQVFEVS
jgi:hypothetical protein